MPSGQTAVFEIGLRSSFDLAVTGALSADIRAPHIEKVILWKDLPYYLKAWSEIDDFATSAVFAWTGPLSTN